MEDPVFVSLQILKKKKRKKGVMWSDDEPSLSNYKCQWFSDPIYFVAVLQYFKMIEVTVRTVRETKSAHFIKRQVTAHLSSLVL